MPIIKARPEPFCDISARALITSTVIVLQRIYISQGIRGALRVIPIIWTLVWSVRGFARYHAAEHERMKRDDVGGTDPSEEAAYHKLGLWLRNRLHKLGPTFIKIGQTLSTRADLLPLPVMLELAKLQEDLEPFPNKVAPKTITAELGAPPDHLFRQWEAQPIAAASLCQAYKAVLFDGRHVVVKVQRPDLLQTINADVQILQAVAEQVMKFPSLCRHTDWPGIVSEFARTRSQGSQSRTGTVFEHCDGEARVIVAARVSDSVWGISVTVQGL